MKTTLEISDGILAQAKALARDRGTTLRNLTEQGLRKVLDESQTASPRQVNPVTFRGKGLSSEFRGASWERIRGAAYEGHGS